MAQHPLDISIEAVSANIVNFIAFKNAANNNLLTRFSSRPPWNQSRKGKGKHKAQTYLLDAAIAALPQELTLVKQEKAELEILLKQEEARKLQLQEIQIEIDLNKLAHQVTAITQTDYFQQLQIEVEYLRKSDC